MPPVTRYQSRLNKLDCHRIAKHTIPVVCVFCISKEAVCVTRSPVSKPPTSPAYHPTSPAYPPSTDFQYQPVEPTW
jgi:hypothetical protein